jgi:1-aminocyclopropane-1-carboxylate deaminase/D-cysteine desulfhydrase-like pyridoxal-dependent ACC family enzyme
MSKIQYSSNLDKKMHLRDGVSPIRRLHHVSNLLNKSIYIKDDSAISTVYGGSKVRKLEYILQDILSKGAKNLVTIGSWGSHHILATARHVEALGHNLHAVVLAQPDLPHIDFTISHSISSGAHLYPVGNELLAFLKIRSLMKGMKKSNLDPYFISLGGSSDLGVLGTVNAAFEMIDQVNGNLHSDHFPIYMALGSGSSVAGLALGLAMAGKANPINAIQVTSSMVVNRFILNRLLNSAAQLLVESSQQKSLVALAASLIKIDKTHLGRGYGWPTIEGLNAIDICARDDLTLDPIYTSKVFSALIASSKNDEEVLYWHTHSYALTSNPLDLRLPSWYLDRKKRKQ